MNCIHLVAQPSCCDFWFGVPMEQEETRQAPIRTSLCICLKCQCPLMIGFFLWENFLLASIVCSNIKRMHSLVWMNCVIWNFWPGYWSNLGWIGKRENYLCLLLVSYTAKEQKDLWSFLSCTLSQENHTFRTATSNNGVKNNILFLHSTQRLQSIVMHTNASK